MNQSENITIIDFGSVNLESLILTNDKELYERLKAQGNIGVLFEPSVLQDRELEATSNFYLIGIQEDKQDSHPSPKSD